MLIGDAAHASSPNMAQGAAMAVEDALVLAAMLTEVPLDQALAEYEHRRRARVTWVQEQTHRRDRTRSLPPMVRNRHPASGRGAHLQIELLAPAGYAVNGERVGLADQPVRAL